MKLIPLCLCILILLANCQKYQANQKVTQGNQRGIQMPSKPVQQAVKPVQQPVRGTQQPQPLKGQAHPKDNHSVGMSYQSPPADEDSQAIGALIGFFMEQFKDVHIDEYETEDGTFKNIDLHLQPPKPENIFFKFDEKDNSLIFVLHGVSVSVETDMDLYFGTVKGHTKLSITNLDIDLNTKPVTTNGVESIKIDYHLHLKDADIKADITASEDLTGAPEEISGEFMPFLGNLQSSFKIATTNMIDSALEEKTEKLIDEYVKKMNTQYTIPRKATAKNDFILNSNALPLRFGDRQEIIVDFDTSSNVMKSSNSVGKRLEEATKDIRYKSPSLENSEQQLENVRATLNDNKHHVLIAPHMVTGLMSNINNDVVSFKLENQEKLQAQVRQYFGDDVELECYNHESEYPQYRTKDDSIIGDQMIKCVLHLKGQKFEPLYTVDLNLNFSIHPKVDKDGKSLKAEFGNIQATSINTHQKGMEVQASVSDKYDAGSYNQFDSEMLLPFLLNQQNNNKVFLGHLEKFSELLKTPNLINIDQLENDLFSGNLLPQNLKLPLPEKMRLVNSNVKIHENGVIDISGDMRREL